MRAFIGFSAAGLLGGLVVALSACGQSVSNENILVPDPQCTAEICDGSDNDCDGAVDELSDLVAPSCSLQAGVCASAMQICDGTAGWRACGPDDYGALYEVEEQTCDGRDNDCDGDTDEGYLIDGVYAAFDHCGACGVSCADATANGQAACDASQDPPQCIVSSCDGGYLSVGDHQCLPIGLGLCEPCTSAVDCALPTARCLVVDSRLSCLNPCSLPSDCPSGFNCADPGVGELLCVPTIGSCSCDSEAIGTQRGCAVTYSDPPATPYDCFGVQTCGDSGWQTCILPSEICNGFDDNCDGVVDEGFVAASGLFTSDTNCGACGNDCTQLTFGGNPGVCNAIVGSPTCSIACSGGCVDLNAEPSDGCECCDPEPDDFPDEAGVDENCDGVDGEQDNAIFVVTRGDDTAPGTLTAPKQTISAGIVAAAAAGLRDVYVAAGVYQEQVELVADIGVYGGFSADFRTRSPAAYMTTVLSPPPAAGLPGAVNCIDVSGAALGSTVFDGFGVYPVNETAVSTSSYGIYLRNCDGSVRLTNNRILGGTGGDGSRGGDGGDGAHGNHGAGGVDALDLQVAYGVVGHECDDVLHLSAGGPGGQTTCGALVTDGGTGGVRACPVDCSSLIPPLPAYCPATPQSAETRYPLAAENGMSGANEGGTGGAAGRDVSQSSAGCNYQSFGTTVGKDGADGVFGDAGPSGAGCANTGGTVLAGLWMPGSAGAAGAGFSGAGGGGGGSGGGSWTEDNCIQFGVDNLGGSGGGGGAGGCAGTAGTGGMGGGSAFKIFVVYDSPPGSLPMIADNILLGGQGGTGGAGGRGGRGGDQGAGGAGGAGGGLFVNGDATYAAFAGGRGGDGGAGGHGGGGGGGCGGSSYGIFAHGLGGHDPSAWSTDNTFSSIGSPGLGGTGGASLGHAGTAGSSGVAVSTNF